MIVVCEFLLVYRVIVCVYVLFSLYVWIDFVEVTSRCETSNELCASKSRSRKGSDPLVSEHSSLFVMLTVDRNGS